MVRIAPVWLRLSAALFLAVAAGLPPAWLLAPTPVAAAGFMVDSQADEPDSTPGDGICASASGNCTLRAAITEANALAGGDTITLPAGTYTLTRAGQNEDEAATGDLDITGQVTITGAGMATTVVEACNGAGCTGVDRVFDLHAATVTLSGMTIQNGRVTAPADSGGGVRVNAGATLTLTSSTLLGNGAASGDGGGIATSGTATITDSTFAGNFAGQNGGGIRNAGFLTITDSTVFANFAGGSAGGIHSSGRITVSRSTISNNLAGNSAGGVLTLDTATFANSTISTNVAATQGGGVVAAGGGLTLENTTVASNSAPSGGGVVAGAGVTTSVFSTIIANFNSNCSGGGTFTSLGRNISGDATCGFSATGDLNNVDPLLGPLQNNGGATATHALQFGSPAVNAGTTGGACSGSDQRGTARPQGVACDIGAFEMELPTRLAISTPVGVMVDTPFAVTVTAQDDSGTVRGVASDTTISVLLNSGAGTLSGTLTGTIPAGSSSTILILGYSVGDSGVVITARRTAGDDLASGNTRPFSVASLTGDSPPDGIQPPQSPPASERTSSINAASGGTVTTANAALVLPAGSVDAAGMLLVTVRDNPQTTALPPAATVLAGRSVEVILKDATGNTVTTLAKAATVTVQITAADLELAGNVPSRLRILRYDEATRTWRDLGGVVDLNRMTITVTTDHFSLFAVAVPQPAPTPTGPADSAVVIGMNPVLAWSQPDGTRQFHVQVIPVNNDGPGLNLIVGAPELVALSRYAVAPPQMGVGNYLLLPGMKYTWRVRITSSPEPLADDAAGWSAWSPERSFRTGPPTSATIRPASPSNGATVDSLFPPLRWSNSNTQIYYYEVQLSQDATFTVDPERATAAVFWELVHGGATLPNNTYQVPLLFPLEAGKTYYWRVRPWVQGDGTPVDWSDTWSFRTP